MILPVMIIQTLLTQTQFVAQLYTKIFGGLFCNGAGIFIICLFGVAALAFWVKAKLES